MSRKIKSVKLKNDYRDRMCFIPAGTELTKNNTSYWWLMKIISIHEDEIKKDITDLYDIEYEHERKSITVKIEYENMNDTTTDLSARNIFRMLEYGTEDYGCFNVYEVSND